MKTLITGVTGFFGPHLARELIAHSHKVIFFSRKPPPEEFKQQEWIKGDINNAYDCLNAMCDKNINAIQHAAAMSYPTDGDSHRDPAVYPLTMQTNIVGYTICCTPQC